MKRRIALLIIAFLPLGINAWAERGPVQQEVYQILLEHWNLENYPRILQLDQDDLIYGRVDINAEFQKMTSQIGISLQRAAEFEKPFLAFEKPTGSKTVAIIGYEGRESWTTSQAEIMISFCQSIGIPNENIYILRELDPYSGPDENGFIKAGPFTRQGMIDLVSQLSRDPEIKRLYISIHHHGGSYISRKGDFYGYNFTPVFVWDPNSDFVPTDYESKFEICILVDDMLTRTQRLDQERLCLIQIQTAVDTPRAKIWVTKYVTGSDFYPNAHGQLVAKIFRQRYYFSFADENGEVNWGDVPLSRYSLYSTDDYWKPEIGPYLETEPIESDSVFADYDRNGVADVPFLMITESGDTLLCVRMNIGDYYTHSDLISNGTDLNNDGFIGGEGTGEFLDINGNSQDDLLVVTTIFKLADYTYMSDLEFKKILQMFNPEVEIVGIFCFCHSGGFLKYIPNAKSIFFSSVGQFQYAGGFYPIGALKMGTKVVDGIFVADKNRDAVLTFAEILDYMYGAPELTQYYTLHDQPQFILLKDNSEFPASNGPWPKNGQGYVAENFILATSEQVSPVEDEPEIPYTFSLSQNYPNPFNPSTTIGYSIPRPGHVSLRVYNLVGQEVVCLVNENQLPGYHQIIFDGSRLSSGTYFYVLETGGHIFKHKMTLTK